MRDTDFDAVLRLKCIANGWHIPVVIFGCFFEQEHLQYGVVVLRDAMGLVRSTFCILNTNGLVDIHSRMCEVVCDLIETIGTFPDYNYVFLVDKDLAHLCKYYIQLYVYVLCIIFDVVMRAETRNSF